jgi:hypothetical protein
MLIELFIGWNTLVGEGGRCKYVCSLANPSLKGLGLALGVICHAGVGSSFGAVSIV